LKLTTDRHKASRGLYATAELLVYAPLGHTVTQRHSVLNLPVPSYDLQRSLKVIGNVTVRWSAFFRSFVFYLSVHSSVTKFCEHYILKTNELILMKKMVHAATFLLPFYL